MEYTTVSDLKNQAKKLRKNNPNVKNHADSLNKIAQEQGFKTWQDLLDHSVLPKKNSVQNKSTLTEKDNIHTYDYFINNIDEYPYNLNNFSEYQKRLQYELTRNILKIKENVYLLNLFFEKKDYKRLSSFLFDNIVVLKKDTALERAVLEKFLTKICKLCFLIKQDETIKSHEIIANLFYLLNFKNFIKLTAKESDLYNINQYAKEALILISNRPPHYDEHTEIAFRETISQIFYLDELEELYKIFKDSRNSLDISEYFKDIKNVYEISRNPLCVEDRYVFEKYKYITDNTDFNSYYKVLSYVIENELK